MKTFQTATFRPKGLLGRLYLYSVLPFHFFVFDGMAERMRDTNHESKKIFRFLLGNFNHHIIG
ncbi:MAG: DUF2867 domain-containing protein [Melioribacter sp.]|nr:DUF2867 domain-containing protein [Melioribacter sp.]